MRKFAVTVVLALVPALLSVSAFAQNWWEDDDLLADTDSLSVSDSTELSGIPEGFELVDTLMYIPAIAVDTSLVGKNIFTELSDEERLGSGAVRISQSGEILAAMDSHFVYNAAKTLTGYRVRIFFDNKQSARTDSEATVNRFKETYPEVPIYWSYVNPYFKVTVGDYRTRSEAMQLLHKLKDAFPAAFIVRESISYPAIDKEHAMVLGTVQVLRPIPGYEAPENPDSQEDPEGPENPQFSL